MRGISITGDRWRSEILWVPRALRIPRRTTCQQYGKGSVMANAQIIADEKNETANPSEALDFDLVDLNTELVAVNRC